MGVRMGSLAQVNTALTGAHSWAKAAAAASAPSTAKAPYSRRPPIAQASLLTMLMRLPPREHPSEPTPIPALSHLSEAEARTAFAAKVHLHSRC